MTASQWFRRYGWVALLSLAVPGLASAAWLHFVNRDAKNRRRAWVWSILAAAAAFAVVVYSGHHAGAIFFSEGAGMLDHVAGAYLCGAIATALVVVLTLLWAFSPLLEIIGAVLRIFD